MTQIKVLSWNIQHGLTENGVDINKFIEKAIEWDVDIIFIQEMDRWVKRSGWVDQFQAFRTALGLEWDSVWGTRLSMGQRGVYGIATFSKFPIYESTNHVLADRHREKTILQESILKIGKDLISIANVHMPYDGHHGHGHTETSWKRLFDMEYQPNLILGGDFNATPNSAEIHAAMNECIDIGKDSTSDAGRIDYLVSRGMYLPIKHETVNFWLSDHLPIITTFAKTI